MKLKWSMFNICEKVYDGVVIRNTMTGTVVTISQDDFESIDARITSGTLVETPEIEILSGDIGILVDDTEDEFDSFDRMFLDTRENGADTFTFHLLPTLTCQLSCSYCYENGCQRKGFMSWDVVDKSLAWLDAYFSTHKLSRLKLVLFGGEPLLGIGIIKKAIPLFVKLAEKHGLKYCTQLVSNGELLNESTARFLSGYSWDRLQITLDGPKDVHDRSRFGKKNRPTFDTIIRNVLMVLHQKYIEKVDIRINFGIENQNRICELLEYLASLDITENVILSFGIIMPTIGSSLSVSEALSAGAFLSFCAKAKELGFAIPVEYTDGPWCVATEKHSAVLQPDGSLQKCISTVGRHQFNFTTVEKPPVGYARDERFEMFERTNSCRQERCPYLPICGGGCPWEAIVESGEQGYYKRFCRKTLFDKINRGLLKLNFS